MEAPITIMVIDENGRRKLVHSIEEAKPYLNAQKVKEEAAAENKRLAENEAKAKAKADLKKK